MIKKILFCVLYILFGINLFAFDSLPKIYIGETEVYLGMTKKEIVSKYGEPDSITIDVVFANEDYNSMKMDYSQKQLLFFYTKCDEETHTINTKQDFFLLFTNGEVVSKGVSIKDVLQLFPDIHKISEDSYVINFIDEKRTFITDDIYFYFGQDGKLEQITITNDYY